MVHNYRDMRPRGSHILDPLTATTSGPKGGKIIWNDALEDYFKELKHIVSAGNFLSHPDWTITFTVHTDTSDKQSGAIISQNNKPITLFSIRSRKPHHNSTTTEK